jgi:hypothetical protein
VVPMEERRGTSSVCTLAEGGDSSYLGMTIQVDQQ